MKSTCRRVNISLRSLTIIPNISVSYITEIMEVRERKQGCIIKSTVDVRRCHLLCLQYVKFNFDWYSA